MKKKLLFSALILVLLCVIFIFLGLRQNAAPAGSTASQDNKEPITATLAVCGDIMSHSPQTNDAYDAATDTYSYLPCFQSVSSWIEAADYAVANFETTLNGPPYSGYPQFCAPDALAYDLKTIGFDLVTTANNHSMDKGFQGLARTLDVLDQAGLQHVGTYRTQEAFTQNNGVIVADVGGISVAFLAYAESLGTDLIAVMVHWGIEYQTTQNAYQEQVADFLISHGADLILGSHSHVPQPLETRTVTLDDGSTRSGLVCYSLGNFVSNQSPATVNVNYTDTTAILNLELTKDPATGETTVSNINYVPLLVLNRGANVQDRYIILDVNAAIAEYKAGNTTTVSDAVYQKLEYALEGCHTILGEKYDTAGSPPAGSAA